MTTRAFYRETRAGKAYRIKPQCRGGCGFPATEILMLPRSDGKHTNSGMFCVACACERINEVNKRAIRFRRVKR